MSVIYVDRLSFFSLARCVFLKAGYSRIFYFNKSPRAIRIAEFLKRAGILKALPESLDFHIADMKDSNNGSVSMRITEDLRDMCIEISDRYFLNNSFLKNFRSRLDFKKILIFFEKILAIELRDKILFINVARELSDAKGVNTRNLPPVIFLMEKDLWFKSLTSYADKSGLRLIGYNPAINFSYLNFFTKSKKFITRKVKDKLGSFLRKKPACRENNRLESGSISAALPFLGMYYSGRPISFDLDKRSDFFLLFGNDIPRGQVLAYFDRFDSINIPISEEKVNMFSREKIRFIGLSYSKNNSERLDIWVKGAGYKRVKKDLNRLILKNALKEIFSLRITPFFYIGYMFYFAEKYAYWLDFFTSHNIKVNVCHDDFQVPYVPLVAALEEAGGASVSYQCSNLGCSTITLSSCSDIMFSFGPSYRWIWEKNRSAIKRLVYCGYITDYSFKEARNNALKTRKKILGNGANFIICFFDENSSDDRRYPVSNRSSVETYRYLIEKMMKDKTLGLIFKPKFPGTIYKRISPISSLIEEAKGTGRCVFLNEGEWVSDNLPAEAAQASDLCVGALFSGTTILESFLSGTPSVLIDLEGLYYDRIYEQGLGKVVFDSLDGLFSAIEAYRKKSESADGFGDLSSWIKGRDPFKDGNASLRMKQYIAWLLEGFGRFGGRDKAIFFADERYEKKWGEDNIANMETSSVFR